MDHARFEGNAKEHEGEPVMSSEESSDLPLTRSDKLVGLAVGFFVPGAVLVLLVLSIALHWPDVIRISAQVLLFVSIVWVVLVFPKWWTRRKVRRQR